MEALLRYFNYWLFFTLCVVFYNVLVPLAMGEAFPHGI